MSSVNLYLLGSPRIELNGAPATLNRRKAMALVAYLALAERAQSRATVATLLWPELDDAGARNALRSALPLLTGLTDDPWIYVNRTNIVLNRDFVWSDVQAFLAAVARTRLHNHEGEALCAECLVAFEEAANVYHGDFLSGFGLTDSIEYDDWQTTKQEWLRREYTNVLRHLAEYYGTPRPEYAISYARRWLEADPLNEAAHRLLMRLYAANGQRSEAMRQYQDCVRILDEEMATLPEDETVRLADAIRDGSTLAISVAIATSVSTTSVLPPLPPLIIGREEVLSEIKVRLGIPNAATRRAVTLIEGWPGVGKSTTIAALAHDSTVANAFPDGVMWTSLGETPNLLGKLSIWGEALHLIPPNKTPRLEELTSQLTTVLRDKRMLLIVDDVWQADHAAPFRVGGQHCALVMSSRLKDVAHALAPAADDIYRLPVLTDDASLTLLSRLAPEAVRTRREAALKLVRDLEGLPLAIQVAGRLLHEEMQMGWGVDHLLAELHQGANILVAQAPSDVAGLTQDTSPTVAALLKRSTDALDEQTLLRFALLGFFIAKPATFDLAAMAAAWDTQDPRPTARILVNRGLLEPLSGGRFQMHALLVLHAKSLLESPV